MHKIKLILLLILPLSVLGQDLGIIDTKTTKNPAINGTHRISTDGQNLFFRNFFGVSKKIANTDSPTFTGNVTLPNSVRVGGTISSENNTYLGKNALPVTTSFGVNNTAIGSNSSALLQYGNNNTSVGYISLGNSVDGTSNTAIGVNSLGQNTTGSNNTGIGLGAGRWNTTGANNTYLGYETGNGITTGSGNTVVGASIAGWDDMANYVLIGSGGKARLVLDGTGKMTLTGYYRNSNALLRLNAFGEVVKDSSFAPITSPTFITDATTPRLKITGAGDIGKGSDLVMAGNSNDLTMHGTGKVILGTGGFQRLVVTNAGNVGVGTTAPVAKFEVSGLAGFRYNDGKQADGKYLRSNSTGVAAWDSVKVSEVFGLNTTYLPINNPTATGTLTAPTIANSLGANFATTSGNVGIGIASPAYKLDVSGTARFTGAATFTGGIISNGGGGIASNTAIGQGSLTSNTTGITNTSVGTNSLNTNTTGNNNTSVGYLTLQSNTVGNNNSAFNGALTNNTSGSNNSAFGYNSLINNTTGGTNSAFGTGTLLSNTTGIGNVAIGSNSLIANTTANYNTAVGNGSMQSNTTGIANVAFGLNAGRFISGGSVANTITNNSVYIGADTKPLADNQTNQIVIGHNAVGNGSNTTVLGNTSTTQTQIFGNTILSNTSQAADTGEKLQVNGTAKFVNGVNLATTSGNVGIGTTSPTMKLDVNGGARFGTTYVSPSYTNTINTGYGADIDGQELYFNYVGYNDGFGRFRNTAIADGRGSAILYTVGSTGRVGIGTTTPAYKLDVKGGNASTARFDNGGQEYTEVILANNAVAKGTLLYTNSINDLSIRNKTAGTLSFGTSDITRMTMFANGRVGINTTTDAGFLLDVNGITRLNGNVSIGTANNARTLSVQTTSNDVNIEGINSRTTGNNYAITGNSNGIGAGLNMGGFFQASGATSNHGLRIYNVAATANNYSLYSDSPAQSYFQGSVGIGTASPNASSILDITSTTKGVLFPRMTTTEISAISSPADGLTVYNTTLKAICFYDAGAAVWKRVSHSNM